MSRYPLRQPPAGWRLACVPGEGWYVLDAQWQPVAGPYTERWYAVQVADRLVADRLAAQDRETNRAVVK